MEFGEKFYFLNVGRSTSLDHSVFFLFLSINKTNINPEKREKFS